MDNKAKYLKAYDALKKKFKLKEIVVSETTKNGVVYTVNGPSAHGEYKLEVILEDGIILRCFDTGIFGGSNKLFVMFYHFVTNGKAFLIFI